MPYGAIVRHHRVPLGVPKGWLAGPWESSLPVSVGYASEGIDEPHVHPTLTEVYLVARGTSQLRVGVETVELGPGSVVIVEPGEPHTFLTSSRDYLHFVLHLATNEPDKIGKVAVDRSELGL
jgi:mannose-6-phosphate isomerase-like protein (cupin superfamily)